MRHATRWGLGLLLVGFWLAPGSLWAGDFTFHNAATANATGSNASVSDRGSVGISVTISGTATVTFEGSADGVTFSAILCTLLGQTDTASSTTTSGQYLCSVGGLKHVQTPLSGCAGCTVTVKGVTSTASRGGGSGGGVTGWPTSSTTKEITWANSLANAMRVGDGVTPMCFYTDATLGPVIIPCTASNTQTLALTNFNWSLWDQEGAKAFLIVDPDSIGAGSGTLTMQTSEQFVASNLGIEFAESDTNPTCAAGNYNIHADSSETKIRLCENGTVFYPPRIVRKTADETVNNSGSLQDDDHLVFAVDANSFYTFSVFLLYSSATTADLFIDFSVPASATGRRVDEAPISAATVCATGGGGQATFNSMAIDGTDNSIGGVGVGTTCVLTIRGQVLTAGTAGNVQFRWAQGVGEVSDTKVLTDSYLVYQKL